MKAHTTESKKQNALKSEQKAVQDRNVCALVFQNQMKLSFKNTSWACYCGSWEK